MTRNLRIFLVLICVCLALLAWAIWQLVAWLAQGDNAFIVYCVVVLSIMFVAGVRDEARRWR